jgi:MoaA/NifB/PqqE/SkfB family radical SAM enzyme
LKQARRVLKPKGKVTSLMTITSVNYAHISETGTEIFDRDVDEWHLTTLSVRDGIEKMKASEKQIEIALHQITEVAKSHKNIFLRIYNLDDMRSLISVFGKNTFSKLLKGAKVTQNAVVFNVGGFSLFFYPTSIAPGETLVIDADGWWRLPYCIKYTLDELGKGYDSNRHDISVYNVTKITKRTDVAKTYKQAVFCWQKYCGEKQLLKERGLFKTLF